MTGLDALWLPILLSAVMVFFVSFVLHMLVPWHKADYGTIPNEDRVRDALRPFAIPPGDYMVPRAGGMEEMRSPAFAEKVATGPNLVVTVLPSGPMSMKGNLINWFLYIVAVGYFAAYIAGRALGTGAEYLRVFQMVGAAAFIGYSLALWQMSIWYRRAWGTTFRYTIDGLVYSMLTAGTFGWLWPR